MKLLFLDLRIFLYNIQQAKYAYLKKNIFVHI